MKTGIILFCVCMLLLPAGVLAEEQRNETEYFTVDEDAAAVLAAITPEAVLEGFYGAYAECAPYIREIEIIDPLYSYGELRCLVEGVTQSELRDILERGFGFSMKKTKLGYFCEMEEGRYDVNKVSIETLHDTLYLTMQDADFAMAADFKHPVDYIEQLGDSAFLYQPENAIVSVQSATFDFVENSVSLSNQYLIPNQDRQGIADRYLEGFRGMEGYCRTVNAWGEEVDLVRKSEALTVTTGYADESGTMIVSTICYKEPTPLDSSAAEGLHALRFEDLYNDICKKTLPVFGGTVSEVCFSQYETFSFGMITVAPELVDKTANNVVITELKITDSYDWRNVREKDILTGKIVDAAGGGTVYSDAEHLVIYQEGAFVIRMYMCQDDDGMDNQGKPYIVCTFLEINVPGFEAMEELAVLEWLPGLNADPENEPVEAGIILREAEGETRFTLFKAYYLEHADYDACITFYSAYFAARDIQIFVDSPDDGFCYMHYITESERFPGVVYVTSVECSAEGAASVFVRVSVEESSLEEYIR